MNKPDRNNIRVDSESIVLKENIQLYRTVFEAANDAIFVMKGDRFIECNQKTMDIFGCDKPEDIIGHTPFEFSPPHQPDNSNSREKALSLIGRALKGEPQRFYWKHIRKNGDEFDAEVSLNVIKIKEKTLLLAIVRDITDRKLADASIKSLYLRNKAILASVPDIIMEVDKNKIYTWANQAGLEFFGNDVVGKEAAEYFIGEQQTYQKVQPLFEGDESVFYVESWQRRRDGEKRLMAWWCRALKDDDDNVTGALSTARDITTQQEAEEKLRDTTEKLKLEHKAVLEKNIALKQILDHMETEKRNFKQEIASNIYDLIYPIILELQKTGGRLSQRRIDLLENSLKAIMEKDIEEFKINYNKLTPREMDVCELIGKGLSSKEIAESLMIASETVNKHRESIRRKLQIKNKNINLSAYLRSKLK